MSKQQSGRSGCIRFLMLIMMFFVWCGVTNGAEQPKATQKTQYKIYILKHISPQRGIQYLTEVKIGTVSQLPATSAILVTARPSELTKADAVLKLVDTDKEFGIKAILPAAEAENLPTNEEIAAKVGNISIGSFSSPPEETAGAKVIIDVHNGSVVAIAPVNLLERIVWVIGQMKEGTEVEEPPVERAGPGEPNVATPATRPKAVRPTATIRTYEPEPLATGEDTLSLTLPEKMDIIALLDYVGKHLQLNYMYDSTLVKGEVTLKLHGKQQGALRVKDLYPLLESALKFRGFVMSRNRNLVTIVPAAQVLDIDPALQTEKGKPEYGDVVITAAFRLKHIDTNSAMNLLTSMKLGTVVTPIPDTSTIIVTEYAYRMGRIEELLEMIDKPGEPRQFRFRQLKYTMAKTLAPKVKTLAEQLGTVSITIAAATVTPAAPQIPGMPPRTGLSLPTARITPTQTTAAAQAGVYLDADERTNRILMIGLEAQLTIVESLIEALDVQQQDLRSMKLYKIEHVDAEEVKKKLQELGIIGGAAETPSRITGSQRTATATPESVTPQTPGALAARATATSGAITEAVVEQPQVVVLTPTNSLLINATPEQHTQIAGIIKYVDSETEKGVIPYTIYPLENQKPTDMATVLEKLIQETVKDKEGKIERVVKKTEEEIIIVPDENTFSLIVYASKKNQEWIGNLIKTLDKRRPQVLIDVTLVEISKSDEFEYDLNLVESFPDMTHSSGLIRDFNEIVGKLISKNQDRFIDVQAKSGAGTGFYADKHVNVLLSAMQSKGYGRVLAKPKILVNDNEKGTIKTTDTTYVKKTSSAPISTGAAGQQYTPIETAVSYEPYDAGITLDITPHISEGKLLRLEMNLTRSDFVSALGDKPPDTTSSDITTIVTVPDGSTIILGGMLKLKQNKGGTKVPLLGDIPIVGGLFRSTSTSDSQRKLYVFVKAEIIRPAETAIAGLPDLEKISERNRMAFEKHEAEFQGYQIWPGIKPKPVEPVKILETQ
jgi:type II secretory pathway component GspD/PulD (secretin)